MRVLIIDDDKLVAASLRAIISAEEDCEVVGTGHSGEDAIRLYKELSPDVLLMDIRMEGMSGLEAGEGILREAPHARILYLTTFNDDEYLIKALSMGAKGYIIKQDFESIVPALAAVHGGQTVFGSAVSEKLSGLVKQKTEESDTDNDLVAQLTPQEAEIAECVSRGLSNREIADELCLSEGTVRNYLSTILRKLDLKDRTNLAILWLKSEKNSR